MDGTFLEYETGLLRQMSAEQKLRTLDSLRRSALLLVEAGVRARKPDIGPAELQSEVRRIMCDDPS